MTRKCHNQTLQTNTSNTNSHMTARSQLKQNNQFCLPQQEDYKIRHDTKHCMNNLDLTQPPQTMGVTINNDLTTTEPSPLNEDHQQPLGGGGGGGLNAFTFLIFTLDSAIVKAQKMFSSHGCLLTYAMFHHRQTI